MCTIVTAEKVNNIDDMNYHSEVATIACNIQHLLLTLI